MPGNNLSRAALFALLLVVVVVGAREISLRSQGVPISYDNGQEIWSVKRRMVYDSPDMTTVFIGSSRIKYDLDIDTWQKETGRHAVQLAIEGSSPLPVLMDLAHDPKFHGRLVIDITEPLVMSKAKYNNYKPEGYVGYHRSQTIAQLASFELGNALESGFVFLDRDWFSLNAELEHLNVPKRPGIFVPPTFPWQFSRTDLNRQTRMTEEFVKDTALRHMVQNQWMRMAGEARKAPPPKGNPIPGLVQLIKGAVDAIRARGGEVVFLRTPCSGGMLAMEMKVFPRQFFWDPLLAATRCQGVYFADYPATARFECPEWSHLSPQDAVLYTKALITELPRSFVE